MQEQLARLLDSNLFMYLRAGLDFVAQEPEAFLAIFGLVVALWALRLQRREITKNGKINALVHASKMLQEKIDFHNKIMSAIEDDDSKIAAWHGHAHRINHELRPLKNRIDHEFLNVAAKYDGVLHEKEIREALEPRKKGAADVV